MILVMAFFLITYTFHSTWVTSEAYSSPSIVLSARGGDGSRIIFDDFREAYYWLRHNTPEVPGGGVWAVGTRRRAVGVSVDVGLGAGRQGDVVVGLRLPDHRHGQPHHPGGQQHLEQHPYLPRRAGRSPRNRRGFLVTPGLAGDAVSAPGHGVNGGEGLRDHEGAGRQLRAGHLRRPHRLFLRR